MIYYRYVRRCLFAFAPLTGFPVYSIATVLRQPNLLVKNVNLLYRTTISPWYPLH
jgi:hypothetical protein